MLVYRLWVFSIWLSRPGFLKTSCSFLSGYDRRFLRGVVYDLRCWFISGSCIRNVFIDSTANFSSLFAFVDLAAFCKHGVLVLVQGLWLRAFRGLLGRSSSIGLGCTDLSRLLARLAASVRMLCYCPRLCRLGSALGRRGRLATFWGWYLATAARYLRLSMR